MNGSADAMEERQNMIARINAGILNYLKRIRLRSVGATILGGFAGLSLTSNIIPSVMSHMGVMDSFSARWALGGYAVYSIMAWGVGGRAAQKSGSKMLGALILGFVGLVTGLLFTGIGISTGVQALLIGGGAATLYGGVGGMIIADALREPSDPDQAGSADQRSQEAARASQKSDNKTTKQKVTDGIRLFRFFK